MSGLIASVSGFFRGLQEPVAKGMETFTRAIDSEYKAEMQELEKKAKVLKAVGTVGMICCVAGMALLCLSGNFLGAAALAMLGVVFYDAYKTGKNVEKLSKETVFHAIKHTVKNSSLEQIDEDTRKHYFAGTIVIQHVVNLVLDLKALSKK